MQSRFRGKESNELVTRLLEETRERLVTISATATVPHCSILRRSPRLSLILMSALSSTSQTSSYWELVHCHVCYLAYTSIDNPSALPSIPFWITECGHVLCNNHLSNAFLSFVLVSRNPLNGAGANKVLNRG